MPISGRIVALKDKSNNNIFPTTSSEGVYMDNGKTLEQLTEQSIFFDQPSEMIQLEKPEIIEKINNIANNILKIDSELEKKVNKTDNYKNLNMTRLYRDINDYDSRGSYMQGGTYIKDNKAIYALYDTATPETNMVQLVEINIESGEKIRTKTLELGHCNSLSYDSSRNLLLVAKLNKYVNSEKQYVNEIVEINYDTLEISKTVSLDVTENVSAIVYNKTDNKVYVMLDYFIIAKCNPSTYSVEERINLQVPTNIKGFIRQSFEIWNNHIFLCGYAHNYISVYDFAGTNVKNYYVPDFIDNMFITGELEDISSLGNGEFLMFSVQNVGNKYLINMVSKFDLIKQVASGVPYAITNANGPLKIYVDINSTSNNPNGSKEKPFKQLHEAILSITSPLFPNVEIYLADGVYDWTYIGQCNSKIFILGNSNETTQIKGMFLNGADVSLDNVKVIEKGNDKYNGCISLYNSTLNVNNLKINSVDYGIYATTGSTVNIRNITELNEDEAAITVYGINNTVVNYQKTASNTLKSYVDNSSQLYPNLLIYNNTDGSYLTDIPIPKWFEGILKGNSLKYIEFNCGIKVSTGNPSYHVIRVLLSGYQAITLSLSRVSGTTTYISTINYKIVTEQEKMYLRVNTAYTTTIEFSTGSPVYTTKTMTAGELGSIFVFRIYVTN